MENLRLAFLFLIDWEISQEELWQKFFNKAGRQRYNIYVNCNNQGGLKCFYEYYLKNSIKAEETKFSYAQAMFRLLSEALKDQENYKFIFLIT